MTIFNSLLILFVLFSISSFSLTEPIEIYLIDAYCSREVPHKFKLSFYTNEEAASKVVLDDEYEYVVTTELTDLHKAEIEIHDLSFADNIVEFIIITETGDGRIDTSEVFDFDLPYEPKLEGGSDFVTICLFAGAIFLLPYPNYIFDADKSYFSLTKEIPVVSFRTKGDYPGGYLSLEYTYIFDSGAPNYLRAGYKKIFELQHIEYISPGVSLYTNFSSNHGISPELSFGLFTIKDTFTLYARYRYNINLSGSGKNFNEISVGLYSAFFSLYL
ncbi:MAG: hypothetical protein KJN64_10900 [Ignavibacteria bacterium]|nr:hypothetical protein [Ignavibacteria bacterium]MBT8382422.1 hypothetical protein [Ignavibacteria bacterium]MBT8390178.1 hypothetical protein [Ignavibacteria bacterium]NNJ52775.1 hypothetical protein [Ignavibacteriaceae bacterium]NNL20357.1 hypothetical protein [Ignavibacteriaceae bacterium]